MLNRHEPSRLPSLLRSLTELKTPELRGFSALTNELASVIPTRSGGDDVTREPSKVKNLKETIAERDTNKMTALGRPRKYTDEERIERQRQANLAGYYKHHEQRREHERQRRLAQTDAEKAQVAAYMAEYHRTHAEAHRAAQARYKARKLAGLVASRAA